MLKRDGRYEHNGTEYLKGAEWAGLTCWVSVKEVEAIDALKPYGTVE